MDNEEKLWRAYQLLCRIQHEIRWATAKWLLSDVFRIVDAEANLILVKLQNERKLREDRGWIRPL